jgi:hypothetical protein
MIPKLIHYCWFGGRPLPEEYSAYIEGWKRVLPDYEFKLWNESNFNVNIVPFTAQVAAVKKWGFIVDYIRAWAVYNYGGVFLDADVEIVKPLDDLLRDNVCFAGFEDKKHINPGSIFAGEKNCRIARELMDFYAQYSFVKENGELNQTASPVIFTDMLMKYGLKQKNVYQNLGMFTAYPTDYFCPKDFVTGETKITTNTYTIHHFAMSWFSELDMFLITRRRNIIARLGNNIPTRALLFVMNFVTRCGKIGVKNTLSYYTKRYITERKTNNYLISPPPPPQWRELRKNYTYLELRAA